MDLTDHIEAARNKMLFLNPDAADELIAQMKHDRMRVEELYRAHTINLYEYAQLYSAHRRAKPSVTEQSDYIGRNELLISKIEAERESILNKADISEHTRAMIESTELMKRLEQETVNERPNGTIISIDEVRRRFSRNAE